MRITLKDIGFFERYGCSHTKAISVSEKQWHSSEKDVCAVGARMEICPTGERINLNN